MKKMIFALTMLLATSAMAQESVGNRIAYCSSVAHHGIDLDIYFNDTTNDITIRATGGDGYPKDYVVTSLTGGPAITYHKHPNNKAFIYVSIFSKRGVPSVLINTAKAADGSELILTLDETINLKIGDYSQDTWCKVVENL